MHATDIAEAPISWSTSSWPAAYILLLARLGLRRGLSRLASRVRGTVPVQCGGITIEMDLESPHERHLFLGFYERDVLSAFKCFLRPGDVAIDVGANIGFHAAFMANLVGPAGHVYALEPSPAIHPRLIHLAERNPLKNITVIPVAASDSNSEATLYISAVHGLTSLNNNWNPETTIQEVSVRTVSLDQLLSELGYKHVRLVKIDVEGHEWAVFKGLRESLFKGIIDVFVFEVTPPNQNTLEEGTLEILNVLERHEYLIYGLSSHGLLARSKFDNNLSGIAPGYNVIAVRKTSS